MEASNSGHVQLSCTQKDCKHPKLVVQVRQNSSARKNVGKGAASAGLKNTRRRQGKKPRLHNGTVVKQHCYALLLIDAAPREAVHAAQAVTAMQHR